MPCEIDIYWKSDPDLIFSLHFCVGFLFLVPTQLVHTELAHTELVHTQLVHTQLTYRQFNSHITCSHTTLLTQLYSHYYLFTQLVIIQLAHTQLYSQTLSTCHHTTALLPNLVDLSSHNLLIHNNYRICSHTTTTSHIDLHFV